MYENEPIGRPHAYFCVVKEVISGYITRVVCRHGGLFEFSFLVEEDIPEVGDECIVRIEWLDKEQQ